MSTHSTACSLDCPDSCSLEVEVVDGRVAEVRGTRINPLTDGFICSKVRRISDHLYGDDRLLYPARRSGEKGEGRFERLTWDQAYELLDDQIRSVLERRGGEGILPLSYGGSNGLLTQDTTDARFFYRLGASQLARTVCAAPSTAAATGLYGKMAGVALEDYVHSRMIIVWGANPSITGIHLVPIVRRARDLGAKLVVVDPRKTPLAKQADFHLAPLPGTDLAIALCMIRDLFGRQLADQEFLASHCRGVDELQRRAEPWSFERAAEVSGVDARTLAEVTDLYAQTHPAVIRCGWGVERNRNGGSAVSAILALPAVAGKFGVRGGGYTMSNSGAYRLQSAVQAPTPTTRVVNMNHVGRALLELDDPPIDLLFVYNANPLATLPDQQRVLDGLKRRDLFTVVFDQVMTDTARYADLVLPATTFLEHHDLARGYGAMVIHPVAPVVEPAGEARPNVDVFAELTRRLHLDQKGDLNDAASLAAQMMAPMGSVPKPGDLLEAPAGSRPIQLVDVHPKTTDRKIDLCPETLDREAPKGLYSYRPDPGSTDYPLALISPATSRTISSTFGQLTRRPAEVEIHPDDATARGIEKGTAVRIFNGLGEMRCRARPNADLRRGVVVIPKGLWARSSANGATSNSLVPDSLTDLGGGACFNDARVEIEVC